MTASSGETPRIGARVFTADGHELGKVKEVGEGVFEVDVRMHQDYWLPLECIASSDADVRLGLSVEQLEEAKIQGPAYPEV